FWNFENIRRNKDVSGQYPVVAYGNQSNNQTAAIDPIQTPNFYDLDAFSFLRIEGHLRKNKTDVITDLNTQKANFDLPFNVVAVRLQGTSTPDDILGRCNFNDLRSQYVAYRGEMYCFIQRLFDHFFEVVQTDSTAGIPGSTSVKPRQAPKWIRSLLQDTNSPTSQGNSSALFLPAYYALPGQQLPHIAQPFVYSPTPLSQLISIDLNNYLTSLASRLTQLGLLLPDQLDDFDFGADNQLDVDNSFIGSYIDAVSLCNILKALFNEISDQVTHSSKNRFTQEQYFMFGQWLSEQMYFLNEFITDCKYNKLAAVFYEMQYRINYLQTNDPTVFSNFITRNPGIIHGAGTTPGGTFVLVYPGATLNFSIKVKEQLAAVLYDIQVKEIRRNELRAIRGRSIEQNTELIKLDSQLCDLYAVQVQQPVRPVSAGIAISAIPVQQISIDQDEVIADFWLPYLSNCECECDDIPAPTTAQLGIPAIAMPSFYEFFLGDYAFAKDIITNTFGCTTPAQLTIDIRPSVNYTQIDLKEPNFKLKFIVNGDVQNRDINVLSRSSSTTTTSAKGGTVLINPGQSNYDVFVYTPPANFLGTDSFEYVFELYDRSNNILLHSNKAKVTIVVTTRCKPATAVTNSAAVFNEVPATT
ncbi:MAG TPA: Ig-like domain-containing protein, partial [Bacteroidia bacterium]|nr:Ig-like domain-containing protein [Bacteroidia bacterium]